MAGRHILVIDDDPVSLRLMLLLLRTAGHSAVGASSGEEGLAAAQAEMPDLVLCDGRMPHLDGFEVVKRIRAIDALAAVPVVAVTGLTRTGEGGYLLDAGFDGYIAKPFDIKSFASEVSRFLVREAG